LEWRLQSASRYSPVSRTQLLRWTGLFVAMLGLVVTAATVPLRLTQLRSVCAGASYAVGQLTAEGVSALQDQGLSLGFYAA